jgi:hypothetical protein
VLFCPLASGVGNDVGVCVAASTFPGFGTNCCSLLRLSCVIIGESSFDVGSWIVREENLLVSRRGPRHVSDYKQAVHAGQARALYNIYCGLAHQQPVCCGKANYGSKTPGHDHPDGNRNILPNSPYIHYTIKNNPRTRTTWLTKEVIEVEQNQDQNSCKPRFLDLFLVHSPSRSI